MKNQIKIQYVKAEFGELILGSFDNKLCLCDWRYRSKRSWIDSRLTKGLEADFKEEISPIVEMAEAQLKEYFENKRVDFDVPLLTVGSDFQKSVWNALLKIPYGKTETYLGLSKKIGNEKAVRAVANANGANAISIMIPCHRIIESGGGLGGYAGGLNAKKKLLQIEIQNSLF